MSVHGDEVLLPMSVHADDVLLPMSVHGDEALLSMSFMCQVLHSLLHDMVGEV